MFKKISPKQALSYIWYKLPEYQDKRICVLNGAIRTGKTDFGSKGYINWALEIAESTEEKMKGWNTFTLIGATKQTAYENVVLEWLRYLDSKGYSQVIHKYKITRYMRSYHINEQLGILTIKKGSTYIRIRYMGANNKKAVERIQGMTLRGVFIDEAGLIGLNIIENAIGRCATWRDHRIVMTTNPEGSDTHPFYETYIKGAWERGVLVLSFTLLDNPIFSDDDVEYYRKIFTPSMFLRKVLGKWVRATGGIYKLFNRKRHVFNENDAKETDYYKYYIGVDYGEVDATVFTFIGIKHRNNGLDVLRTMYHKNNEYDEKDINGYADEFFKWVKGIRTKYTNRMFIVKVESATHGRSFYKIIKKRAEQQGLTWLRIELVDKYKRDPQSRGAILERIDTLNLMLGADYIKIDEQSKKLISSILNAVWKPDVEDTRLDDKSVDIDSLDSLEYAFIDMILEIKRKIEYSR